METQSNSLRSPPANCGGIVLCGGKSSRMGTPKALLPFGPERMLQRVVRLLGEAVRPIVVVAAADQELPELPPEVVVSRDRREYRGPLEGLAGGLAALGESCEAAYATACDVPFLRPEFVRRMIELLGDHEIAIPLADGFHHPLAAVYRTRVRPQIDRLLAADRLRPVFLYELVRTREISAEELLDVDPELKTLRNLNRPEDYRAALEAAKLAGGEAPTG
ncbi:MAG TPA: molybdenum cofactor guanylyltransferase [Pirellulales bacterium]|nr:molybdenum cofactor guanylyltransferase [Pirellulales bacterium]